MKTLKFLTIYVSIVAAAIAFSGCRKYLDVNQDPNVARTITPALLLSSGQVNMAAALGVDLNINGSIWGQHWTQATNSSQYKVYEQYLPSASEYDREWGLLYNGALADFRRMEKVAREQNMSQYVAVSLLMQAYTFQLATDAWGDIPFSEALRGEPAEGGIQAPAFDRQEVVYDGLLTMIDSALALIDPSSDIHPANDDLIYGGDMANWASFANTLKLKIGLRMSEVSPAKAQAAVASAFAGGSFINETNPAQINFISTAGNQNPLYTEEVGLNFTQNLVASSTVVDSMRSNEDWRRFALFTLIGGDVAGLRQGNYNASTTTQVSFPSAATGAEARNTESAKAPVKLITSYESYFLQAEAAARGWGGAASAQQLFEDGIRVSFNEYAAEIAALGITLIDTPAVPLTSDLAADLYINGGTITGFSSGGDPDTFTVAPAYWAQYPAGGTVAQQVRHIVTQKWFAMTGTQGFEAWTEWRRTGYPDFFVISATSIIGNMFPGSFLFPNTELTRNAKFPGQKQVTTRVWWDVN